jgi:hypothetical protein
MTPEEAVLGALLANLAAGLKALGEVVARLPEAGAHSELLPPLLRSIGGRAAEICGSCVPRAYAPELKGWMDRIHDLAEKLTP